MKSPETDYFNRLLTSYCLQELSGRRGMVLSLFFGTLLEFFALLGTIILLVVLYFFVSSRRPPR